MSKKQRNKRIVMYVALVGVSAALISSTTKVVDNVLSRVVVLFKGFSAQINWVSLALKLNLTYALQNNNSISVSNVSFAGTVSYEGVFLGNASTANAVDILAGRTTQDFIVTMEVGFLQLPKILFDIIKQGSFVNRVTVNGTISNGVFTIPTGAQIVPIFTLSNGLPDVNYIGTSSSAIINTIESQRQAA